MMPSQGYLLCCIERTGSNLLGHALSATGKAGRPLEYFNPVEQETRWMKEILGESSVVDGLPKILAAGTTQNGMFGAKVHWVHFRFLGMSVMGEWNDAQRRAMYESLRTQLCNPASQRAAIEMLRSRFFSRPVLSVAYARLKSLLPELRLIWLRRENMVARAISQFRARQSGVWYQPLNRDSVREKQQPEFDFAEIHTLYCFGWLQEESWQQFFQEQGVSPLCLTYEDLVAQYEVAIRGTLKFLDIDDADRPVALPVSKKQSDDLSKEWEERYRTMSAKEGFYEF